MTPPITATPLDTFVSDGTNWVLRIDQDLVPAATDGAALGTSTVNWSDLFLDSGAVINFDGGDVTLTHSANLLALGGGNLDFGNNDALNVGGAGNDLTAHSFLQSSANSGGANQIYTENISDTASSGARFHARVAGTSAGDPHVLLVVDGTTNWGLGVDNSSSDIFAFGPSATIGGQDALRATTANPSVISFDTTQGSDHDYVCETCWMHRGSPFVCHGVLSVWHDDNNALVALQGALEQNGGWLTGEEPEVKHLANLGVFDISEHNDGSPRIGMNMVSAQWYTWSSLRQHIQYTEGLEERIAQLEAV